MVHTEVRHHENQIIIKEKTETRWETFGLNPQTRSSRISRIPPKVGLNQPVVYTEKIIETPFLSRSYTKMPLDFVCPVFQLPMKNPKYFFGSISYHCPKRWLIALKS